MWDFSGDPVVKNLPASAGDTGLIPVSGRFHVPWSDKACAPKPLTSVCLEPASSKRSRRNEKPHTAVKRSPH